MVHFLLDTRSTVQKMKDWCYNVYLALLPLRRKKVELTPWRSEAEIKARAVLEKAMVNTSRPTELTRDLTQGSAKTCRKTPSR